MKLLKQNISSGVLFFPKFNKTTASVYLETGVESCAIIFEVSILKRKECRVARGYE